MWTRTHARSKTIIFSGFVSPSGASFTLRNFSYNVPFARNQLEQTEKQSMTVICVDITCHDIFMQLNRAMCYSFCVLSNQK
jgi:hypothetical protein